MIDINELRRLAQAATPHVGHACKYQDAHWLREGHVDFENADLFIASERPQEDAAFYAAANPAAISELIDRLEAAENTNREWLRANAPGGWIDNLRIENEALRAEVIHIKEVEFPRKAQAVADGWRGKCERLEAKVAEMEKQEPVARVHIHQTGGNAGVAWSARPRNDFDSLPLLRDGASLYALPGAKGEEK